MDKITDKVLKAINDSKEPLETKEIESKIPDETRTKILNRLKELWGRGSIRGKKVGGGKGTWIWWRRSIFREENDK